MARYVIVGAGIAGTTAAEEIRKHDEESEVVLIGEEEHSLYSRVLLAPYVMGKVTREKCFIKKDEWYDEKNIEYIRGEHVSEIDIKNKHVVLLKTGREIPYDKLLITTGGEPRYVEDDLKGVSYLRTIDDAEHLLSLIKRLESGSNVVVNGGGFIACEYLNIFKHFNLDTTCMYRGETFWSSVLDSESGALIQKTLEKNNVKVLPKTTIGKLNGGSELELIETTSGEVSAQILGVGVGLERDTSWFDCAGIEAGRGIVTNEFLETSSKDVFAAGDICEYNDVITGNQILSGSWMSAIMQGRVAARNMLGGREEFRLVPSYAISLLGLDIIFVGDTRRDRTDEIVVRGSEEGGYVAQLFLSGGKLIGGTLVGGNTDRAAITKLIESQVDLEDYKNKLENIDFDLKQLIK